jgi:hypothetical protein
LLFGKVVLEASCLSVSDARAHELNDGGREGDDSRSDGERRRQSFVVRVKETNERSLAAAHGSGYFRIVETKNPPGGGFIRAQQITLGKIVYFQSINCANEKPAERRVPLDARNHIMPESYIHSGA